MHRLKVFMLFALPFLLAGCNSQIPTLREWADQGIGQPITNLWRLQVFGEPRMHAVRVRVNTAVPTGAAPFSYSPIWNPLSTDPRHSPRPPR